MDIFKNGNDEWRMGWQIAGALVVFAGVAVVFVLAMGALLYPIGVADCSAKFRDSGLGHRYDYWGGCLVSPATGVWIADDNYRWGDVTIAPTP